MTVYFVSRHEGAHFWLKSQIRHHQLDLRIDHWVTHLDVRHIASGDLVVGTLPFNDVLELQKRKGRFMALTMDLPESVRGRELSAIEMSAYGARLVEVEVTLRGELAIEPGGDEQIEEDWGSVQDVHVAFVSDQLTPLYLAAMQYKQRIAHFQLLATERMRGKANQLRRALKLGGAGEMPVEVSKINHDGEDYADLLGQVRNVLESLQRTHPDLRIVADLTGGTKTMALALSRAAAELVARGARARCMYTNTAARQFQWISPLASPDMMEVRTHIAEALSLQGRQRLVADSDDALAMDIVERRAALTRALFATLEGSTLGSLNLWSNTARSKRHAGPISVMASETRTGKATAHISDAFSRVLRELENWRMLKVGRTSHPLIIDKIEFADHDAATYLSGGWLEEWAWLELKDLGLDDLAMGLQIADADAGETTNQLDIIAMHDNRMLVIEIKTSQLERLDVKDANSALYALDSKSQGLAQLFASRMLLSMQPLSRDTLNRARRNRISVLCGAPAVAAESDPAERASTLICHGPERLGEMVRAWMNKGELKDAAGRSSPYQGSVATPAHAAKGAQHTGARQNSRSKKHRH